MNSEKFATALQKKTKTRKTEKTESRSQTRLDYAEVHPVFAGTAKTSLTLKNNYYCEASMMKNVFKVFVKIGTKIKL